MLIGVQVRIAYRILSGFCYGIYSGFDIIGTSIILQLCKLHKRLLKPLLLALTYTITIGSVISPIGNPQNLLIAVEGDMPSPFASFFMTRPMERKC